jgi:hypothetical protein
VDTKIGHDSPKRTSARRRVAQHVQGFLFSERRKAPAHIKFTPPDKQVKSERILRILRDLNPFVSTAFEDFFPRKCVRCISRQSRGPDYLYHVHGQTHLPGSISTYGTTRGAVELSRSHVMACVYGRMGLQSIRWGP